jgi:hypothetical protein
MSPNKSWPPAPQFQAVPDGLPKSSRFFASPLSRSLGLLVALLGLFANIGVKCLLFPELWHNGGIPHDPLRYWFSAGVVILIAVVGVCWSVRDIVCTLKCLQRNGRLSDSFLFLGSVSGLLLNCLSVSVAFAIPYASLVRLH